MPKKKGMKQMAIKEFKDYPNTETPLNAEKISINSEKISLEGYTTNKINVIKKRRNK